MEMCTRSAPGHDMRPYVSLLLDTDRVILNQQNCIRRAAWSIFLSYDVINCSQICFDITVKMLIFQL